ncbi:FxsB family cyclophane-forming radical SAM/SPASM peptide maturase [Streptomyces sp. NPDC050509]|uniref:FxsB family cyclophane-forming radical SAM/SPASM peptide maturase n=1 Tax=Streptomyces sp. NPDC050509 TaxID=3365620 RepID=UPI0037914DD9
MPRGAEPARGARPAEGSGPVPFAQFIVKVHGRCNLACRYCYLYAGPDRTWRTRPAAASPGTLDRAADRIAEHARAHALPEVALVLHGGEPLLVGAARLGAFADAVRDRAGPSRTVHATVQTNGTLLTERAITTLARHSVRIGVSLDGGLPAHNALRTDHAGRPSFAAAARGARLLATHRPEAYAGVLTVVDPRTDPVELYESLLELRPPALDLLLPHGNWSSPPPGLPAAGPGGGDLAPGGPEPIPEGPGRPTPYGDWLTAVFDRWWRAGRRETRVRLFEECLALLLGLPGATESLGLDPVNAVVVETDGAIEQVDSLKSAYDTAAATGLDIRNHSFDDALRHPGIVARQAGAAALAAGCRACPLLTVCGGGHYAHRYRAGHGFTQRSVYCADLDKLIRHVAARLSEAAASAPRAAAPGAPVSAPDSAPGALR